MASRTYYHPKNKAISCTVYDNGDWELFEGTKSIAHKVTPITSGRKPMSRDAMKYIAHEKMDRHEKGQSVK